MRWSGAPYFGLSPLLFSAGNLVTMDEGAFYATEAGQFIANAYRYLSAAKALRFADDWPDIAGRHLVPTLHVLAHGTELLLEFPLLMSGSNQMEVRQAHGHSLVSLWQAPGTAPLRLMLMEQATIVWETARNSGDWPEDDFSDDPKTRLVDAITKLSFAHDKDSGFALRYTLPAPEIATPRPAYLIQVFEPVAETLCKDPHHLERWYPAK